MHDQGLLSLWKGHRLVCADATVLAPAQRACHRTRALAAPSQRALGLYLPGNEVMLHMAVGPGSEGERQTQFDQLDLLRAGDVRVLDRGYPATWLVQLLHQREDPALICLTYRALSTYLPSLAIFIPVSDLCSMQQKPNIAGVE